MSSVKLRPLCLYSTWNNDLTIQDWVSFRYLVRAGYGDCLNVFVSWSWRQINIHWLHLAHMAWVNMFTPVLSLPQHSEHSQHWCCSVCYWPVLQMNCWLNDLRDQGWNFQSCLVGLNLELPLCLVGPFTDGFENRSLHCVLGTEVPWQLTPKKKFLLSPTPLCRTESLSSALFSPPTGRRSRPPQICPEIVSTL